MKLTDDARSWIYHCLLMDDYPPNQLGRWSDDDFIHAYCTDRDEVLPKHWIVKDAE